MRRNLLGLIALGLVLSSAVGWYLEGHQEGMAAGVGLRVGLVLGALWMAYPQLAKLAKPIPPWLIGTVAVGALVVVIQPRFFLVVAVAVGALVALQFAGKLLKSPSKKQPRRRDDSSHAPRRPPGPKTP